MAHPNIMLRTGEVNINERPSVLQEAQDQVQAFDRKDLYLIAFKGPVMPDDKDTVVRTLGQNLDEYIPQNSFLVYTTHNNALRVAALNPVAWVGRYQPEWKIDPGLDNAFGPQELNYNLIVMTSGSAPDMIESINRRLDQEAEGAGIERKTVQLASSGPKTIRVSFHGRKPDLHQLVRWLSQQPELKWIEAQPQMRLFGNNKMGMNSNNFALA